MQSQDLSQVYYIAVTNRANREATFALFAVSWLQARSRANNDTTSRSCEPSK